MFPLFIWGFPVDFPLNQSIDIWVSHDGSMARLYFNANIKGFFVDAIHGAPYIAAPWILWVVNPINHY